MSNFIPLFTGNVISYPCCDWSKSVFVKGSLMTQVKMNAHESHSQLILRFRSVTTPVFQNDLNVIISYLVTPTPEHEQYLSPRFLVMPD